MSALIGAGLLLLTAAAQAFRPAVGEIGLVEGRLAVALTHADFPFTIAARATGNGADGRGARGHVPLHLELEARDVMLDADVPRSWALRLTIK